MKVALVNNNPAVSRLATLSLSKMGCEYVEVASLDMLDGGLFDVLIIDSDTQIEDVDLKNLADKILYLASKNSPEFAGADKFLFKPFLPTEFVSVMEKLSPKEEESSEIEEFKDTQEFVAPLEESEFVDEFDDKMFDDDLPEIDEVQDKEFALDDLDLGAEFDEDGFDEPNLKDDELTKQLSELVKSIDDMPKEVAEDENLSQTEDEAMQAEMLAREEELLKEFDFSDEPLKQDEEDKSESKEEKFDELMSELTSPSYDEELDVIESIKNDIDEIENLDAKFEEELQEEFEQFGVNEESLDEPTKEDIQNFAQKLELPDEFDAELDDEKFDATNEVEFEIKEQEEFVAAKDKEASSEAEVEDFKIYQSDGSDYENIDQISETEIKRALEEGNEEVVQINQTDVKNELTHKITEHIATSLSVSSIKDALKGMNIKINITFEEK